MLKSGLSIFQRNGLLSWASVSVLAVSLFFLSSLFLVSLITSSVLSGLEERIDISVYFKVPTPESEIVKLQDDLLELPEVASVAYISPEENLAQFREDHFGDDVIIGSLDELGENPLPAILNVKATDSSLYSSIASWIDQSKFNSLIDEVNFFEKQPAIEELSNVFTGARRIGLVLGLLFALLSLVIAYNAVRLSIFNFRREIGVMRLVGAGNWFARGPFLVQGVIYGLLAAVLSFLVLALLVTITSSQVVNLLPGDDLAFYFGANIIWLILLNLVGGVVLGLASSYLSMRKYLKV